MKQEKHIGQMVVCSMKDKCEEGIFCGGAMSHLFDESECGKCPVDKYARCEIVKGWKK